MGMMGGPEGKGAPMMPRMMNQMMPLGLDMMLPHLPKEERGDFALKVVETLRARGADGMSDEERDDFVAKMEQRIRSRAGTRRARSSHLPDQARVRQ